MSVGDARMKSKEPEKEPEPPKIKTPCEHALDAIRALVEGGARVGIVGSRDFSDMQAVRDFVNKLPEGSTVVSGGGRGVDTVAEDAAKARGLKTDIHRADWNRYGKSAGLRRNPDIIGNSDVVVAFHDGQSRGTAHSMSIARDTGKPLYVVPPGSCGH